jgi:hypothetical protein
MIHRQYIASMLLSINEEGSYIHPHTLKKEGRKEELER